MADRSARRERLILWTAAITTLSVFGPYISGNLRLEQFVLIPIFVVVVVMGWPTLISRPFSPLPVLMTWVGSVGVTLLGTLWRPADLGAYGQQAASHGLGAMLTPVMLIIITWFWGQQARTERLLTVVTGTVCAAMTVNGVISLIQFATKNSQIISFLPRFWSGAAAASSVASFSAGNGRYTGIFDQPAVSGIAYGVGLLCLHYLVRTAGRHHGPWSGRPGC